MQNLHSQKYILNYFILLWFRVAEEDDVVGLGEAHDEDAVDDAEPT
jgi:hypothetical protein